MTHGTTTTPAAAVTDAVVAVTAVTDSAAAATNGESTTIADVAAAEMAARTGPRMRALIQTVKLDPRDLRPSWPVAIATLEQLSGWAVFALRLGTLALIQECVSELAQRDAHADLVVDLRALIEALAHMPLEA